MGITVSLVASRCPWTCEYAPEELFANMSWEVHVPIAEYATAPLPARHTSAFPDSFPHTPILLSPLFPIIYNAAPSSSKLVLRSLPQNHCWDFSGLEVSVCYVACLSWLKSARSMCSVTPFFPDSMSPTTTLLKKGLNTPLTNIQGDKIAITQFNQSESWTDITFNGNRLLFPIVTASFLLFHFLAHFSKTTSPE